MSNQRAGKTYAASMSGDDQIRLTTLIRYLTDAQKALEELDEPDSALRFELLVDYLRNSYSPKNGLKFDTKHIGL